MNYAYVAVSIVLSFVVFSTGAAPANGIGSRGSAAAPSGSVVIRVKIPAKTGSSASASRLRPLYVSPSTKSIAVLTDGQDPHVANASGGSVAVHLVASVGTHVFTVTAYDKDGARGNVLSTGKTAPTYVPPAGVVIGLVLGGVVSKISLAFYQNAVTVGSTASVKLAVSAFDADGNLILPVANGYRTYEPLAQPITLSSSDPVDGTLSSTTYTRTDQVVSVSYDGANVRPIAIAASAPGATSAIPVTLTPLPSPNVDQQLIFPGVPSSAIFPGGDQVLTTFGTPPLPSFYFYDDVAVDRLNNRAYYTTAYVVTDPGGGGSYTRTRFDIYETTGARRLVESFQPPGDPQLLTGDPGGVAIDSAAHKIYASEYQGRDIHIYDTADNHAALDTITGESCGATAPSLAVDQRSQHLFSSTGGEGDFEENCGGLTVFSTVKPYAMLATLIPGPTGRVAIDVAAGKLYDLAYDSNYDNPYVAVYDTSSLKLLGKMLLPTTRPYQNVLAVDDAHRLYTSDRTTVYVYRTDAGFPFPLIGTYLNDGFPMAVAPYAPPMSPFRR